MNNEFNLGELQDWNKTEVDDQFFNDAPEIIDGTSAEEVIEAIDKDEKEVKKEKEKEISADEFFNDNPNPDAEDVETPDNPSRKVDKGDITNSTISAAQLLIDKGIIDYELEEGEELDEDTAIELLEEGFEAGVENRIKDLLVNLPNELQALNKYVLNGGNMNEFLSKMNIIGQASGITANLDITTESNQELVVRQMYKDDGMDDDFIDTQLESLKDTGKLADFAKKRFDKWKEQDAKISEKEAEVQRKKAEAQRQQAREYNKSIKNAVSNFEVIKLSSKDKTEIPSYMTERSIKLNNGTTVTRFNQDLMEVLQNETAAIQLAKILRDRDKDGTFNFSSIEKTATTKVTKEIKDNLRRSKQVTPNKSVDFGSQSKSLADYF